ncbi:ribokinase [Phanerochaete sordida]|uniref:Ribokinase n=1 Tax=Phanerochaete sordida TaxID=48140 RepID=A0A9P3GFZ8_9APHY|nr:ribokinase [Phanerochaete sordida]
MANVQREPLCLVRGSINIDEFFHVPTVVQPGETLSSTHFERRAGGKGANQASAVAKAGARVKLIGAVGEDGMHLVQGLRTIGVDVSDVVIDDSEPTGRAIIQLTPEGENCIILHKGANFLSTPPLLAAPDAHPGLSYTHLLLQNEVPWDATVAYLSHASSIGATTVWNPSPLPTPAQLQAFPWASLSWLVVNEGEVRGLLAALGAHAPGGAGGPVAQASALLQTLHAQRGFAAVSIVCTLGAHGLVALLPHNDTVHVPAAKLDGPVRDTTGAGDCFAGYFVAGLMHARELSPEDVRSALVRAVEAAGLCVQRPGAVESIPLREEVEKRLSSQ